MGYIKEMYGSQSPDFILGFLAAMDTYAIHRNGIREIGSPEKEVKGEMKHAIEELGGDPANYRPELI